MDVHVDGNGDCEDLTCNTLAWARWLCEMPVPQDPVLRRLQMLLTTAAVGALAWTLGVAPAPAIVIGGAMTLVNEGVITAGAFGGFEPNTVVC